MLYLQSKKWEREGKKENRRSARNEWKHPLVEIDMRRAHSLRELWYFGEKQGVENKDTNMKRGQQHV